MSFCGVTDVYQCIFCHGDATNSFSVEHIIPESFGNIDHILPPGIVYDRRNIYFVRKIEGSLLGDWRFPPLFESILRGWQTKHSILTLLDNLPFSTSNCVRVLIYSLRWYALLGTIRGKAHGADFTPDEIQRRGSKRQVF